MSGRRCKFGAMARTSLPIFVVALLVSMFAVVTALRRNEMLMDQSLDSIDYRELIPAVVIFGDSTVDAGNNNYLLTVVKSNFPPYGRQFETGASGRFCDGKTSIDYVTERIGYPLALPYLAPNAHGNAILTGVNFASSASGWDDATASTFNVKGLTTQFEWYQNWQNEVISIVGQEKGADIISRSLYVFSTGANDWVNNYYIDPLLQKRYTVDAYTTRLLGLVRSYVQGLYLMGGRNIVVLDLPPLGCLPAQITIHGKGNQGCVAEFNENAVDFNRRLFALINEMRPTLHGGRLVYVDTYNTLTKFVQTPQQYGFSETRRGCCGTGTVETAILCNKESIGTCADAYPYVWWDSFHPTQHAYYLLALDLFDQALPSLLAPPQPLNISSQGCHCKH